MQQAQHARGWNILPKLTFVITIGLITAATGFQARATDVFTDPVGFITLNPVPNGIAFLGLGMTQIPAARGLAMTASGQTLPVNIAMTPGAFNTVTIGGVPNAQYYVENVNALSANAGFSDDIISNDAANLYLANSDGAFIANGDAIKIYPHQTLNSVFGTHDESGLFGSNNSTFADNLVVWDPVHQVPVTYFYKSTSATPGWRGPAGGLINAGQTPLYVDQDIEIISGSSQTTNNIKLIGGVKLGNTITVVPAGGQAFVGNMYATSVTLSNLNLYTGNPNTGVYGSNNSTFADNVVIWDQVNQVPVTYFYKSTSATPGWRGPQGGLINAGTNVLPIGCVINVIHSTGPTFTWTLPAQY